MGDVKKTIKYKVSELTEMKREHGEYESKSYACHDAYYDVYKKSTQTLIKRSRYEEKGLWG